MEEIINSKAITVKEIHGQRVVTFKDVDELHERPEGTARNRFYHNKYRFKENEDYFMVRKGENVKFGDQSLEIPNRGLILLTESGYLMFVKMFNDDFAWQIQQKLVQCFYREKRTPIWYMYTNEHATRRIIND